MTEKKNRVGVYICHCGGNISDVVDVEAVRKYIEEQDGVVVARRSMFMCSSDGQALIEKDIEDGLIDSAVVASCTPALHEETFRGALKRAGKNQYMLEQVNIREQVSWTHSHDHDSATYKAKNLVAAGVAKAGLLEPLEPIKVKTIPRCIVIGGGVSGLRAARDIARWGREVALIEKSPFLGGRMAQLDRVYPTNDSARELLSQLIDEVTNDPNITIYTNAQVIEGEGSLGDYMVKVEQISRGCSKEYTMEQLNESISDLPQDIPNEFDYGLSNRKAIWMPYQGCWPAIPAIDWDNFSPDFAEKVTGKGFEFERQSEVFEITGGTIIMATGFNPYEPHEGEYGYGQIPEVITLPQLIRLMSPDGPTGGKLEVNGHAVKSMAFIHCVGSRQVEGINEPQPDGQVNKYCSRVCCTATLQAANELKEHYPDLHIFDIYQDIRTYGRGHEDYYSEAAKNGVLFFRYDAHHPSTVKASDNGKYPVSITVNDLLTHGDEMEMDVDLVVLSVGMIPQNIDKITDTFKLSTSTNRFLQEVHPKLRPVEMAVEGIMLAGTCQNPMGITEATTTASATAAKVMKILSKDYVYLNPYVATVDSELCTGTGDCIVSCSEVEAISMKDGKAVIDATLCKGCGMCVAACPNNAINIQGWTIPQYKLMVKAMLAQELETI
ncbi:MAG: CoB--CoM heterodisulfide reductase iron-sulfur subunit A family protein [Chloroflexota bacterium]|nr:MAG: CoB--CoM heterodisulfide reductase iron-sulfur subunit A family protein [Chloroflexota bacterium]